MKIVFCIQLGRRVSRNGEHLRNGPPVGHWPCRAPIPALRQFSALGNEEIAGFFAILAQGWPNF